tara:strand:- start:10444 stop:11136 length:693 start_codon:yes stop_codon:yes gene_type:complete
VDWLLPLYFIFSGAGSTDIDRAFAKPVHLIEIADSDMYVKPVRKVQMSVTYDEILDQAIFNCRRRKPDKVDRKLLKKLVEIEKSYNVPAGMKGMLLAAACWESGYNPKAKGDRKFSKNKKTPMAIGMLQLWPVYKKMNPGLDRTDPIASAHAWMKHIVRQIPGVKRKCKYRTDNRIWLAAWVTGIRYKKKGGRCKERPLHYRVLRKWHKNIMKLRKEVEECEAKQDGCGC